MRLSFRVAELLSHYFGVLFFFLATRNMSSLLTVVKLLNMSVQYSETCLNIQVYMYDDVCVPGKTRIGVGIMGAVVGTSDWKKDFKETAFEPFEFRQNVLDCIELCARHNLLFIF